MNWAVEHESCGPVMWLILEAARVAEFRKTLSVSLLWGFRSSKLTPQPLCIFHDLCWLPVLSLPLPPTPHFLPASPLTFAVPRMHRIEHKPSHACVLNSAISRKASKTISLTNWLPNSEWHFILSRRRGQRDTEVDKRKQKMSEWMKKAAP